MFGKDTIQDLNSITWNTSQDQQLAHHKKHIQVLWNHIERLEQAIQVKGDGSVTVTVGQASITLKKNGDIAIKGKNIEINGSGRIDIKSSSEISIKGAKINQN